MTPILFICDEFTILEEKVVLKRGKSSLSVY